jgi:hypothetical protein
VETIFDRMIAERGRRLYIRDQVLAGAADARKGKHNFVARSYLEHYRAEFIKHFDALDEGASDGVFAAIEAAFHLGEYMAATRFWKDVPDVHMLDNMANRRKGKERGDAERLGILDKVILNCVDGDYERLSTYRDKLQPPREDVIAKLPTDLVATEGWPSAATIRRRIGRLKKRK